MTAEELAQRNFDANIRGTGARALSFPGGVKWQFARDGSLSGKVGNSWLGSCSVPLLAARELLAGTELEGPVSLFLQPTHAAQIKALLEMMQPRQAALVILSSEAELACMLACADFSSDLTTGRLHFLAGPDWPAQLARHLEECAGLPAPQQYVRTRLLADPEADRMMAQAGRVLSEVARQRAITASTLSAQAIADPRGPLIVLSGSHFRVWDLATPHLFRLLSGMNHRQIDIDRPDSSSGLAILQALPGSAAVIGVGLSRHDLPMVPREFPIVGWFTQKPLPELTGAGPHDGLIVATSELWNQAQQAGWNRQRLLLARPAGLRHAQPGRHLMMVADRGNLDPEARDIRLSSHRLLFEAIAEELTKVPLALGADVAAYLAERAGQLGLKLQHLDLRLFIEDLILPAYAQGIVKLLVEAGLPLRVYGRGWNQEAIAGGSLDSFESMVEAVKQAAVVVDVWPMDNPPAMEWWGRPVVRARGRTRSDLLQCLRVAIKQTADQAGDVQELSAGELGQFVRGL